MVVAPLQVQIVPTVLGRTPWGTRLGRKFGEVKAPEVKRRGHPGLKVTKVVGGSPLLIIATASDRLNGGILEVGIKGYPTTSLIKVGNSPKVREGVG